VVSLRALDMGDDPRRISIFLGFRDYDKVILRGDFLVAIDTDLYD
jgi:hypothetical protein